MKKTALLCAAALTLLLGAACEKIIEFKGEQTEPRLTISSQAEVGKPLEVYVASSIFFLSDTWSGDAFIEKLKPEEGKVRCFVNGSQTPYLFEWRPELGVPHLDYVSTYVPAPGDHIRLEAEFPGFDPVWAETEVPLNPAFELISAKWRRMTAEDWEWILDDDEYHEVEITLAVTDDAARENFYFLQPVLTSSYPYMPEEYDEPFDFTSNDVIFQGVTGESVLESFMDAEHFFTDEMIRGQRHVFTITISGLPPVENVKRFSLHCATVNESMYWYGKSYKMRVTGLTELFSEGVPLYSNVHGGYGILSAANSQWLDLEVDW